MSYKNTLDAAWQKATKMEPFKMDKTRPPRFRLSSSPFCQYKFLFQWYDYVTSGMIDLWDYPADFYTGIGTAIHSMLQKWIPICNPGLYLGNWKCPECGKLIQSAVGPKFCDKCGRWMRYEEYEYNEGWYFSGHWDGVIITDTNLIKTLGININNTKPLDKYLRTCKVPVQVAITEYKSAGSYKAKRLGGPTPENKAQAMMYVPCAARKLREEGLNVEVIGSIVKYLSRDNPNSASNDFFLPAAGDGLYKHSKGVIKSVVKAISEKSIEPMVEFGLPCRTKFKDLYEKCPYRDSCANLRKSAKSMFKDARKEIRKDFLFLKSLRG